MVPVLVFASVFRDGKRFVPIAAAGIVAILVDVLQSRSALSDAVGRLAVLISVFVPVVLLVSSLVWIALEGKGVMRRYVAAVLPGIAFTIVLLVYFSRASETVKALDAMFSDTFVDLFKELGSALGGSASPVDSQLTTIYRMAVMVMGAILVPLVMVLCGLDFWLAMNFQERNKIDFSMRVADWHLRDDMVWAFLILWLSVAVCSIAKAPYLATALALNLAGGVSVLYALQGFAIILFRIRKKHTDYTAGKLFGALLLVIFLLPGLNMLVVVVLPLMGVTETWILYRKNE
jgi:hypothetical protein